ncbi:hypothetical protein CTAYLR_007213 [Chrysophaeum taylorii]|uniref:Cyclase n=1 Tax=Chrysophaeum taylorii TaxID=2483200 RepID=A0AAD7UCQ1_9STRA|nr:hypothetical protein CTAYLR_007213 [Chrysophaeum taylorii]
MREEIEAALGRLKARCWVHGEEDELGTLNYISVETRIRAAKEIRDGDSVSLSRPLIVDDEPAAFGHKPARQMVMTAHDKADEGAVPWSIENWNFTYHGFVVSHIDSWCHCAWRGETYNGHLATELVSVDKGAIKGSIPSDAGIFVRGVLLDAAPENGWLEPGSAVTKRDLAQLEKNKLDRPIARGDVVLVRTGHTRAMREAVGGFATSRGMPACHWDVCEWLSEKRVAALGADSANDCQPALDRTFQNPVHVLSLVGMGMPLLDNLDLEALATACRKKNRYTFALAICPLALQGNTGSPVNAMALF